MARRGFPVVLSAASGTGKTTLSHLLLDSDRSLALSISATTRAPRGAEEDGVDYHFVDVATFEAMIARAAFLEHAQVHGNHYGSSRDFTEEHLVAGRDVVFDIDVQGGMQIKRAYPESVLIFVLPPSMAELEQRLRRRATDADDVIERRLAAARAEIAAGLAQYDYLVVNERLEQALGDLAAILRTHRIKAADRSEIARRLLPTTATTH
ncbi:MAG: guanylate kinase [Deltaproteobacteria bacterium]|nr:guanylate kinase [Deltaproteobacteria bacterium]